MGKVFKYLVEGNDLAVCLLDLPELGEEVPETGLGDNLVGGEDAHAVKLGGRVGLAGEEAPDDLVLLKATWEKCVHQPMFSSLLFEWACTPSGRRKCKTGRGAASEDGR